MILFGQYQYTGKYSEWQRDRRITFFLRCSQMADLNSDQQSWLETIVEELSRLIIPGSKTVNLNYRVNKCIRSLAVSMANINRGVRTSRQTIIRVNSTNIAEILNEYPVTFAKSERVKTQW